MRNIKLTIEYDGKDFNGWQKQPNKLNIQGEIERAIKDITGEDTKLFRPPYGEINENGVKFCESLGYKVINWDVDSMDWKNIKGIYSFYSINDTNSGA